MRAIPSPDRMRSPAPTARRLRASRIPAVAPGGPTLRRWFGRSVGVALGVGMLGFLAWQAQAQGWFALRRVLVEAPFRQVPQEVLEQTIRRHGAPHLWQVDLDVLLEDLRSLDWVARVQVGRRWPDALLVRIWEYRPVARWGEVGLLDARGVRFQIESGEVDLPLLNGPEGSERRVLDTYRLFQSQLSAQGTGLRQLVVDHRGSWRATLEDGVELRLGPGNPQLAFNRFINKVLPLLRSELAAVAYVDMRYPNGFSIKPKERPDNGRAEG
ncbi:cell division protein FtsQ/DivIB [Candidatus Macondimonas diazotrophica]|uniref:Cell division protein FtsQ n=1 Tax=Candidatus Macondimonas diazotrophica TaxID=2305248 RepID=A0A4Z0FA49_9GAMM|nr:cell division protein FtsQ/DivIB [Candidatus Macondimonas diazotrophica]NCU00213.1 FtsQ-type POTRA domain-containing protein [Candidatus Macondimonas diazotrophica]TFZ83010.1 FtsQ-type POTRA domain-containing protein [Candidatus Macondimonas diazotrophica]HBG30139.1 hypothetical protein [Gammaproteobacteria bacterium]HBG51155.1 hypothetical protein [Gammaproteobacteria bacterium]